MQAEERKQEVQQFFIHEKRSQQWITGQLGSPASQHLSPPSNNTTLLEKPFRIRLHSGQQERHHSYLLSRKGDPISLHLCTAAKAYKPLQHMITQRTTMEKIKIKKIKKLSPTFLFSTRAPPSLLLFSPTSPYRLCLQPCPIELPWPSHHLWAISGSLTSAVEEGTSFLLCDGVLLFPLLFSS